MYIGGYNIDIYIYTHTLIYKYIPKREKRVFENYNTIWETVKKEVEKKHYLIEGQMWI